MKENSIEENIEILEKFKNNEMQRDKLERDGRCGGWKIGDIYKCLELDNAIDNILSDYKRALKENKKLKNQEATARKINELLVQRYSNSIPVQKIKDKIEELKKNLYTVEHYETVGAINVLQELLEGRK